MILPMYSTGTKVTIQGIPYKILHRDFNKQVKGQWAYYLTGKSSMDYGWINEKMLNALSQTPAEFCGGCIFLLNKPGRYCKKYSVFVPGCKQYRRD